MRRELAEARPVEVPAAKAAHAGRGSVGTRTPPALAALGVCIALVLGAVLVVATALGARHSRHPSAPPEVMVAAATPPPPPVPIQALPVDPAALWDAPPPPPVRLAPANKPEPEHFTVDVVNTRKTVDVILGGPAGEPDAASYLALRHELRSSSGAESPIDPRLIALLHQVAKRTGGSVQVLSAFRPPKNRGDHNYHTKGMAADIRVAGMSTRRLRDLVRSLGAPGVGYYPTSQFVHVDMREERYEWTDTSGPGQNVDDNAPPSPSPGAAGTSDAGTFGPDPAPPGREPVAGAVISAVQQAQQAHQPGEPEAPRIE